MADIMQRRNSPMIRTVMVVAVLGSVVYLIYLNHDLSTKLKNSDDRAEKHRRSHESLSAQLQDLTAVKKEQEAKCIAEREEMINRFNANSRDNKMLKSQHDDLKIDYEKLQQETEKLKADMNNLKTEDNREYQLMKQEKELELSTIRDTVANQVKELEQLHNDLKNCEDQTRNIQAAQVQNQQMIVSLQHENQRLSNNLQLANQNAQAGQLNKGIIQGQQQGALQQQLQQQQQNGAVIMNQGDPQGGAVNPNQPAGGGAVDGLQNQQHGDVNQPVVPDVNDQAFQIKPANLGGDKQVGYDHGGQEGAGQEGAGQAVNVGGNLHKEEDDQQHQVQPPNLNKIDDGGLLHANPLDQGLNDDTVLKFNRFRQQSDNKDAQDGHDNSIHNQGPVGLQVQEPVLGGDHNPDDHGGADVGDHRGADLGDHRGADVGLEEEEDEADEEEGQLRQPRLRADHFMQNAHPNKQFLPRNDGNIDEDGPDPAGVRNPVQQGRQDI